MKPHNKDRQKRKEKYNEKNYTMKFHKGGFRYTTFKKKFMGIEANISVVPTYGNFYKLDFMGRVNNDQFVHRNAHNLLNEPIQSKVAKTYVKKIRMRKGEIKILNFKVFEWFIYKSLKQTDAVIMWLD